ncbi:hypothetical protein KQJ29_31770, partial [Enterococcus sp. S181_ASV_20]|nr:hypothetical protein [Enterococcus sp. S181_ASV_20]
TQPTSSAASDVYKRQGAISPEKIQQLNGIGVTGFVLGTSALFGKKDRYDEILNKLRNETVEA